MNISNKQAFYWSAFFLQGGGAPVATMLAGMNITMTSWWVRWRLKSSAPPLFTQPVIQRKIKENIKALRDWPFCGEFTVDRLIPRTNGQQCGTCFHLMTSSWIYRRGRWICRRLGWINRTHEKHPTIMLYLVLYVAMVNFVNINYPESANPAPKVLKIRKTI